MKTTSTTTMILITVFLLSTIKTKKEIQKKCVDLSKYKETLIQKQKNFTIDQNIKQKIDIFFENELKNQNIVTNNNSNLRKAFYYFTFTVFSKKELELGFIPQNDVTVDNFDNGNGVYYRFGNKESIPAEKNLEKEGKTPIREFIGIEMFNDIILDLDSDKKKEEERYKAEKYLLDRIDKYEYLENLDNSKFLKYYTCFFSKVLKRTYILREALESSFNMKFLANGFKQKITDDEMRYEFYKRIFETFKLFQNKESEKFIYDENSGVITEIDFSYSFFHLYYPIKSPDGHVEGYKDKVDSDIFFNEDDFSNFKIGNYDKLITKVNFFSNCQNEDFNFFPLEIQNAKPETICDRILLEDIYKKVEKYQFFSILSNMIFLEYGVLLQKPITQPIDEENDIDITSEENLDDIDYYKIFANEIIEKSNKINKSSEPRVLNQFYNPNHDDILFCLRENNKDFYKTSEKTEINVKEEKIFKDKPGSKNFQEKIKKLKTKEKKKEYDELIKCLIQREYKINTPPTGQQIKDFNEPKKTELNQFLREIMVKNYEEDEKITNMLEFVMKYLMLFVVNPNVSSINLDYEEVLVDYEKVIESARLVKLMKNVPVKNGKKQNFVGNNIKDVLPGQKNNRKIIRI